METFSSHRWIPRTKASDAELWCFLWSAPAPRVEQTMETRWFETPSRSLCGHVNDLWNLSPSSVTSFSVTSSAQPKVVRCECKVVVSISQSHKSHNTPVTYPIMQHFVTSAHFCYRLMHHGKFVWCITEFVTCTWHPASSLVCQRPTFHWSGMGDYQWFPRAFKIWWLYDVQILIVITLPQSLRIAVPWQHRDYLGYGLSQ